MYMPRSYEDVAANYDVIVVHNANVLVVGPHIDKLAPTVSEGGLGLPMSGAGSYLAVPASYAAWRRWHTAGRSFS